MRRFSFMCSLIVLISVSCARGFVGQVALNEIIHVDQNSNDLSVAIKDYTNKQGTITIKVVPLLHIAEKQFYDLVNQLMTDKVVVYENIGCTYDQFERLKKRMASLPAPYPKRADFVFSYVYDYWAEAFGLAKQVPSLNYGLAKFAVHADILDPVYRELLRGSDIKLKAYINSTATNKLTNDYGFRRPVLDRDIDRAVGVEKGRITSLKDFLEPSGTSIVHQSHLKNDLYRNVVTPRNKFIKIALKQLIHSNSPPDEIVLVYGYLHMVEMESWLMDLGFRRDQKSITWAKVLNLNQPKAPTK